MGSFADGAGSDAAAWPSRPLGNRSLLSIGLFDIVSGRKLHSLCAHLGPITAIAFSHNGRLLASMEDTTTLLDVAAIGHDVVQQSQPLE